MTFQNSDYVQMPVPEGIFDLNVGQPSPALLPLDLIHSVDRHCITDPTFLQYADQQGYPRFRQALAQFLSAETGDNINPDELLISMGNSGAINLIGTRIAAASSTRPLALVESPTYQWAVNVLEGTGFDIIPVPVDADGIVVDEIERLLVEEKLCPALIFVIPSHQNPTSVNLTEQRKKKLLRLAVEHDFYILADEAYQLLSFPDHSVDSAFASHDNSEKGVVFTIGTFSKIFAPGVRLGWVQAQPHLIHWLMNHPVLVSGGGLNPVMAAWIEPLLADGKIRDWLANLRQELLERYERMQRALQQKLPQIEVITQPKGGYYIWCRLPKSMDSAILQVLSLEKYKVNFRPGVNCNTSSDYLRLCFAFHSADEIEEAISLLALAYEEYATNLK
jgi:DNA-binding transcriptional MocR family regulator